MALRRHSRLSHPAASFRSHSRRRAFSSRLCVPAGVGRLFWFQYRFAWLGLLLVTMLNATVVTTCALLVDACQQMENPCAPARATRTRHPSNDNFSHRTMASTLRCLARLRV